MQKFANKSYPPRRRVWTARVVSLALSALWVMGPAASWAATPDARQDAAAEADETYQLYRMLADALDQVERNYVTRLSRRELFEAAIEGVIRKLDPYSDYIKPSEMDELRQSVENDFTGIGVRLVNRSGQLTVLTPLVGTPAYRAGLKAGDRIVTIDDTATSGMSLDDAVQHIKGPVGSTVRLTIQRTGSDKTETVYVRRDVIQIETVMGARRKKDSRWDFVQDAKNRVGYVRITLFGRNTASELRRALEELEQLPLRGLVIDLRFNPGGLLSAAIETADLFVAEGQVVTVAGRNAKRREVMAHREGTFLGFPVAVLVNRYSASGSEILAACLQDHGRAVVVGERTWGKGSVQNVIELEGGRSALKLTTSRYLRPSGKNIHRLPGAKESDLWGVQPDDGYEVSFSDEETARLLYDRRRRDTGALDEVVGSSRVPARPADPPGVGGDDETAPFTAQEDRQLQRALAYLYQHTPPAASR